MAAWDPLDKGVLVVQRHDVAFAQALSGGGIQTVIFKRLDAHIKRQIQIQLFQRARPVVRGDFT
ncbi:hypothetical protein D3C87_2016290 [compost metagenome]